MDMTGPFRKRFAEIMESVGGMLPRLEKAAADDADPARREALAHLAGLLRRQADKVAGVGETQVEGLQVRLAAGIRANEAALARGQALAARLEAFSNRLKTMDSGSRRAEGRGDL